MPLKLDKDKKLVCVGTIGRPVGVRGEFTVQGRDTRLPEEYRTLFLNLPDASSTSQTLNVEKNRYDQRKTILKVTEINSREAAAELTGSDLWIERNHILIDSTSEYLWDDLIGNNVVDCDQKFLGISQAIYNFGGHDILYLTHEDKELMIPIIDNFMDLDLIQNFTITLKVPLITFEGLWTQVEPTKKK
jgi:16S rRNA processing protein RimM